MFMREILAGAVALLLAWQRQRPAADRPELGKPVSEADLALWDISVGPDGAGLPPGAAHLRKARLFTRRNASCATGKRAKEGPTPRSAARNALSRIMCLMRRRFLILRAGRCRGSSRNLSPTMKSTR